MFRKILVAVDGSNDSDRAIHAAAEIAVAHGSDLVLCHAFHIPEHYRTDLGSSLRSAIREDGEDILTHATKVAEQHKIKAETRLLSKGHPAEAVLEFARDLGAELIVAGVRGRAPDQIRSLGTVSRTIAEEADCSVLLVRRT